MTQTSCKKGSCWRDHIAAVHDRQDFRRSCERMRLNYKTTLHGLTNPLVARPDPRIQRSKSKFLIKCHPILTPPRSGSDQHVTTDSGFTPTATLISIPVRVIVAMLFVRLDRVFHATIAGVRITFQGNARRDEVVDGAEEWAEGHEAGAKNAKEELGSCPPDIRDERVCGWKMGKVNDRVLLGEAKIAVRQELRWSNTTARAERRLGDEE